MKKYLCLILAAMLLLLTGCGGQPNEDDSHGGDAQAVF